MTSRDDFDRHLAAWLSADAPKVEPEPLLGQVLARTAHTRRRPAWRIPERWIPMSAISTRAATVSRVPLRTIGVVALLLIALALGAVLLAGAQRPLPAPFGPAGNGRLLSVEGGDIVSRATLDAAPVTLIAGPAEDVGPWPSGDGTRFTFYRATDDGFDLWVADVDGSDVHRLAGPFTEPGWTDWAPSGDAVLVNEVPSDGDARMSLVDTRNGTTARLDVGMPATQATFRPVDGRQISFVGDHPVDGRGLYLVDRDGTGLKRLDMAPFDDPDPTAAYLDDTAWSPTGDRIAFHSRDVSPRAPEGRSLRIKIADIDPAGIVTAERVLPDDGQSHSEFDARWLPTGDAIVYKRLVNAMQRLSVATVGGSISAPRDIATGTWMDDLTIAPDGRSVLYLDDVRGVKSVDIASGDVDAAGFATDDIVAWQRAALP